MEILENRALALLAESWRRLLRELRPLGKVLEDGRGSSDEWGSFLDGGGSVSSAKGETYWCALGGWGWWERDLPGALVGRATPRVGADWGFGCIL